MAVFQNQTTKKTPGGTSGRDLKRAFYLEKRMMYSKKIKEAKQLTGREGNHWPGQFGRRTSGTIALKNLDTLPGLLQKSQKLNAYIHPARALQKKGFQRGHQLEDIPWNKNSGGSKKVNHITEQGGERPRGSGGTLSFARAEVG